MHPPSIAAYIAHDHCRLDDLLDDVDDLVSDRRFEAALEPLTQFMEGFSRHAEYEERIVFTLYERLGEAEATTVEALKNDHSEIVALVMRLMEALRSERLPAFIDTFDQLSERLRRHALHEEDVIYPRLEGALGQMASAT